jgi:hypothetical protein
VGDPETVSMGADSNQVELAVHIIE